MRTDRSRGHFPFALALAVTLTASGVSSAVPYSRQDGEAMVIADGEYAGSHGAGGIFFLPLPTGDGGTEEVVWAGEMDGDLQFTSALGALEGDWDLQSEAIILGDLPSLLISGTQTGAAVGTISGHATRPAAQTVPQLSWKMLGTAQVDSSVTAEMVPTGVMPPQTSQQSETMNVTLEVQEFWATCQVVNGTWIYIVEDALREAGLVPRMAGSFWAYRSLDADDEQFRNRIQATFASLHKRGVQINSKIIAGEIDPGEITVWLGEANKAMFAIQKTRDCGLDAARSDYLTPLTFLAFQMSSNLNHLMRSGNVEDDAMVRILTSPAYIAAASMAGTGAGNVSPEGAKRNAEAMENNLLGYAQRNIGTGRGNDADRAKVVLDAAQVIGSEKAEQFVRDWLDETGGE